MLLLLYSYDYPKTTVILKTPRPSALRAAR